jgi:hypothetical protein
MLFPLQTVNPDPCREPFTPPVPPFFSVSSRCADVAGAGRGAVVRLRGDDSGQEAPAAPVSPPPAPVPAAPAPAAPVPAPAAQPPVPRLNGRFCSRRYPRPCGSGSCSDSAPQPRRIIRSRFESRRGFWNGPMTRALTGDSISTTARRTIPTVCAGPNFFCPVSIWAKPTRDWKPC